MTENMKDLEDALVLHLQAVRDNTAALQALYALFKERGGVKHDIVVVDHMKKTPATIEEVQNALIRVSQAYSHGEAGQLLLKRGANKLPQLKAELYEDLIAEAEALLEAVA